MCRSAFVANMDVSVDRFLIVSDETGLTLCKGATSRLEAPEIGTGLNSK